MPSLTLPALARVPAPAAAKDLLRNASEPQLFAQSTRHPLDISARPPNRTGDTRAATPRFPQAASFHALHDARTAHAPGHTLPWTAGRSSQQPTFTLQGSTVLDAEDHALNRPILDIGGKRARARACACACACARSRSRGRSQSRSQGRRLTRHVHAREDERLGTSGKTDSLLSDCPTLASAGLVSAAATVHGSAADDDEPAALYHRRSRQDSRAGRIAQSLFFFSPLASPRPSSPKASLSIPDWFMVLEAQHRVLLYGHDTRARFVELLNHMHRLERDRQNEDLEAAHNTGHHNKGQSVHPGSYRRAEHDCGCCPSSQRQPVQRTGRFRGPTAREKYDHLMAHINECMSLVARQDQEVIRSRHGQGREGAGPVVEDNGLREW